MKRAGRPTLRTARPVASLRKGRNNWYEIKNQSNDAPAEIRIYDEIGYFGVSADDFVGELNSLQADKIELRLNTPGGDAFDGIAIYNALRNHKAHVTSNVDALAASAGSIIAMAGDVIKMRRASQMMIHDAHGLAIGNAKDMREMAELLDRLSNDIASVYLARAGGTLAEWRDRMLAESWYSGPEAVAVGLADESEDDSPEMDDDDDSEGVANSWDLSIFNYQNRREAPAPPLLAGVTADLGKAFRDAFSELRK